MACVHPSSLQTTFKRILRACECSILTATSDPFDRDFNAFRWSQIQLLHQRLALGCLLASREDAGGRHGASAGAVIAITLALLFHTKNNTKQSSCTSWNDIPHVGLVLKLVVN
eukprot:5902435-Amphidinium_carterae.2